MQKFKDYFPNGYKPHLVRNIPKETILETAIELGMDENTSAPSVAAVIFGAKWKCNSCGSQTQLISFNRGFREYCSTKCSNNALDVKEEKSRVNRERYGTIYPTQSLNIRTKISKTKKERAVPTKTALTKFLNQEQITFKDKVEYLSLNEDRLRIYPLDYIEKYKITDKKSTHYFLNVSKENELNGIRTIWIKPWEFLPGSRKQEVLKSYILAACGKIKHTFNGRDCEVKELAKGELRPFLETNSFYGFRSASINLGLYLKKDIGEFKKGTLLMLYTFGHPFFGGKKKKYDLEVIRASTLLNSQVRGGASKLFKHFTINYNTIKIGEKIIDWQNIVYYVDFDHNSGNSLPHLGYDFIGYSMPGFMNVDVVTGIASQRKPMDHANIKEKIKNGEMFSVANAGVKIFTYTKKSIIGQNSDFVHE